MGLHKANAKGQPIGEAGSELGGASPVHKHGGRVGPRALQVGHGVPLVDAALLRGDAALVEGHPREGDAPWEVVEAAGHLACLVEDLQGRPAEGQSARLLVWNR